MAVDIAALSVRIEHNEAKLKKLQRGLKGVDRAGKSAGKATGALRTGLLALGGVLGGRQLLRGFREVLRVTVEFETQMNNVRAITNSTTAEFAKLTAQARALGSTTQFTARDAAAGMGFLARTGLEVKEIMGALPRVLNLAAASGLDLATSADIATNIMKGMGLEVADLDRVVDVLAKTTNSANTDMLMLGDAMKDIAPIAASAGQSIEETAALIGILGDAGIQGQKAGVALRNMLINLTTGAGAAGGAIKRLDLTVRDSEGTFVGLTDIFAQLGERTVTDADLLDLFGKRAVASANVLRREGADGIRSFTAALDDAAGTAQRMQAQQMAGLVGAVKRLQSAWEGLKIAIGKAFGPALAKRFNEFATFLGNLTQILDGNKREISLLFGLLGESAALAFSVGVLRGLDSLRSIKILGIPLSAEDFSDNIAEAEAILFDRLGQISKLANQVVARTGGGGSRTPTTPAAAPAQSMLPGVTVSGIEGGMHPLEVAAIEAAVNAERLYQNLLAFRAKVLQLATDFERDVKQTWADAIYNAFAAAFDGKGISGLFEAFIKTILTGIGQAMVALGTQMIVTGTAIEAFKAAIAALSGGSAILIGAGLVAAGSALVAAGSAGGQPDRGTAAAGSFREPRYPGIPASDVATRTVSYGGSNLSGLTPAPSVGPNWFIGVNDAAAQRAVTKMVEKAVGRGYRIAPA